MMRYAFPLSLFLVLMTFVCRAEGVASVVATADAPGRSVSITVEEPGGCGCSCPSEPGLLRTITGYLQIKQVCLPCLRERCLEVNGFCRPVVVYTVMQDRPAPLAVLLLGISGQATGEISKHFAKMCYDAGFSVLMFDSTFRPEMVDIANRGVSGNLWNETETCRDIINTFLTTYPRRENITKIGVVGMSYGGVQALVLGRLQSQGKLPFKIDAIQAYSPPVDMRNSAQILDDWYNAERFKYTLVELYVRVGRYKPDCGEVLCPSIMKAAIAASFERELVPVVDKNDRRFHLCKLSSTDAVARHEEAAQWGFMRFAYGISLPYWRERLGGSTIDELLQQTRLEALLQNQPPCTEAFIAADDPFNTPEDLKLMQSTPKLPLTILPGGGHLGYMSEAWVQPKLQKLFECGEKK